MEQDEVSGLARHLSREGGRQGRREGEVRGMFELDATKDSTSEMEGCHHVRETIVEEDEVGGFTRHVSREGGSVNDLAVDKKGPSLPPSPPTYLPAPLRQ